VETVIVNFITLWRLCSDIGESNLTSPDIFAKI
jgi:hypothetical protein